MHVSCCLATLWCRRDYYIFFIGNLSGLSSFVQGNTFVLPALEHACKVAFVRSCCIAHQLGPSRARASMAFSVGHVCKMCVSCIDLIWKHLACLLISVTQALFETWCQLLSRSIHSSGLRLLQTSPRWTPYARNVSSQTTPNDLPNLVIVPQVIFWYFNR